MRVRVCIMGLLIVSALTAGCQALIGSPPAEEEVAGRLVWPQPPLRPRIHFVKAISRPEDLGVQASFWERAWGLLVGREEEWFIRPTGVTADERVIFIADAGAQALWILDPQGKRFRKLQQAGVQRLVSPVAVARGPSKNIYLADSYLGKVFILDSE